MKNILITTILTCLISPSALANIYKTTDKQGHTVFTDVPPDPKSHPEEVHINTKQNTIETHSSQTEFERKFAQDTAKAEQRRYEAWTKYDSQLSSTHKAYKAAEKHLEETKAIKAGDLINTARANGTNHPRRSQEYYQRVKQAEANLEKTRHAYHQAKRKRPQLARPSSSYKPKTDKQKQEEH